MIKSQKISQKGRPSAFHSSALIGNTLYVFGGLSKDNDINAFTNQLSGFNLISGEWFDMPQHGDIPCPRAMHAMTTVDNSLVLYGGYDMHLIETPSEEAKEEAKEETPSEEDKDSKKEKKEKKTSKSSKKETEFRCFNGLYIYSIDSHGWRKVTLKGEKLPEARAGATLVRIADKNKVILFGGSQGASKLFNDAYIIDLEDESCRFVSVKGMKVVPRSGHSAHWVGSAMYIVGGWGNDGNKQGALSDVCSLILDADVSAGTGTWKTITPKGKTMPPRSGHGFATVGAYLCVSCGAETAKHCKKSVYLFNTLHSKWIRVKSSGWAWPEHSGGSLALATVGSGAKVLLMYGGRTPKGQYLQSLASIPFPFDTEHAGETKIPDAAIAFGLHSPNSTLDDAFASGKKKKKFEKKSKSFRKFGKESIMGQENLAFEYESV
eukprot:TRINITY_DN148_c0_g1_i1.p1 TRINITY_DN148_c0_g1~~TRINITY_DN148_c0_g1_i1.p1  ORF type:complete len:435 (-),score=127.66 TRINITY_DN148_c0_g1_i1:248-1552(-)